MPKACDLCGHQGGMNAHFPAKSIVKCPACGLVFYEPSVQTHALYTAEYFTGVEYRDYREDKREHQRNFRARVKHLLMKKPAGRLFEIGCAYGFFLELARAHWDVIGIDIAESAVEYARDLGLPVILGEFLDMADQPNTYDIVCLWDTIEHLAQPVTVLRKLARWLKPGGICVLTTGDLGSVVAKFRGARWRQIHPPTHLHYFSCATLSRALRSAGLDVVETSHVGYYRSYQSMLHGLCKGRDWRWKAATMGGRVEFSIYLNLMDIVMVTARKPNND